MSDRIARQITDTALGQIARLNGCLRALIHVDAEGARAQSDELDGFQAQPRPLLGTTFVAKDLIDVAGQPTRGGSRLFGA